jgi:hemerythrin-like domain-containing protein
MALLPGGPALADFRDPIGMLGDCHRRVERFLGAQVRVAACPADQPLDRLHAEAVRASVHYFETNAPWHTADEEDSLFPRLRASSHPQAAEAARIADALQGEHAEMAPLHDLVHAHLRRWLEEGRLDAASHGALGAALAEMARTYADHIAREDGTLFPLAARILTPEDRVVMGQEMRQRRQEEG